MISLLPALVVALPLATAAACAATPGARSREIIHLAGSLLSAAGAFFLIGLVMVYGPLTGASAFFFVDPLSAVVLSIVALVSLVGAAHSIGYIRHEIRAGELTQQQGRRYYTWFHAFVATMYFVLIVNNLGIVWVAVEATTITSAFLVALYRKAESLEAAWKYLMLCSVGIAFALLGLIFLYSSAQSVYGPGNNRLDFSFLAHAVHPLPAHLLLLSFALVFVGYGTKAGLAPLHFWLPDAHSQAPSPISAMLSGALLNTALYGVLRMLIVVDHDSPSLLVSHLLLAFGLLALAVAFPFLLLQQDIKRMLAFSSVEQMGILVFGAGLGTEGAFLAVMLQMFNHSMAKSTLFFTAGNLVQKYRTKQIGRIRGALRVAPVSGAMFLVAALALVGAPPFALFSSEFLVAAAGFAGGHQVLTGLFLMFLAALLGAFLYQAGRMLFGEPVRVRPEKSSHWTTWPLFAPLLCLTLFGWFLPQPVAALFQHAALVLDGRMP